MAQTIKFTCAHLVSDWNDASWGQTYHQGSVFVVLEVHREEKIVPEPVRQAQDAFVPDTTQSVAIDGRELLQGLIADVESEKFATVESLQSLVEQVVKNNSAISLVLAKIVGENLLVITRGGGRALLCRHGSTSVVSKGNSSASGIVKNGDRIFLLSASLVQTVPPTLFPTLTTLALEDAGDEVASLLHPNNTKGAAGILVDISDQTEKAPKIPLFHLPSLRLVIGRMRDVLKRGKKRAQRILPNNQSKRKWLSIVFLLIVIFVVMNVSSIKKKEREQRLAKLHLVLEDVLHEVGETEALEDINASRAKTLIAKDREKLTPLLATFPPNSPEAAEISDLLTRIDGIEGKAAHLYRIKEPDVFFDLTVVKNGAVGSDIGMYEGDIVILDKGQNAVYLLTLPQKKSQIVAGGRTLKNPHFVASHGERIFIFTDDGIYLRNTSGGESRQVVASDGEWGRIGNMKAFAGNIYLLDNVHNQIIKYPSTDEGLGEKIIYLPDDASHSFSANTHMAIDGIIWTITGNRIQKFVQGRPDASWQIFGWDESFSEDSEIYTDDSLKNLYILDHGNKRIVVFDKRGMYQAAYEWKGLDKTVGMVVSENEKKIVLLGGSVLYSIDIR